MDTSIFPNFKLCWSNGDGFQYGEIDESLIVHCKGSGCCVLGRKPNLSRWAQKIVVGVGPATLCRWYGDVMVEMEITGRCLAGDFISSADTAEGNYSHQAFGL